MLYLMGQGEKQMLHLHQDSCMVELQDHNNHHKQYAKHGDQEDRWMMIIGDDHHDTCNNNNNMQSSFSSSFEDTSTSSNGSSSLSSSAISSYSDLLDDDDGGGGDNGDDASSTSSSHSPSSSNTNSPLYELSDLMAQLPIKRGLSKFYPGKSQSYTSLSRVMSLEDLAKKETPYRKKMKSCKSYGAGLDAHKSYTLPKATIAKKVSRGSSFSSLSFPGRKNTFLASCRPPPVPVQKHF